MKTPTLTLRSLLAEYGLRPILDGIATVLEEEAAGKQPHEHPICLDKGDDEPIDKDDLLTAAQNLRSDLF